MDRVNVAEEYTYDANGNITKDLNKNITSITCNALNLPSVITFSNGNSITYVYDGGGSKLSVTYQSGGTTSKTEYVGNKVYKNGTLSMIHTEEGYATLSGSTPTYYYNLKDHQGNNRVVINQSGTVQQVNHYYAFGGLFSEGIQTASQPYKYNGKELDRQMGLDMYDYGARHYDAALGRWFTVDPLSEKYYTISPYAYCANNPIKFIDPTGMAYGDFINNKGNIIGNDGIDDQRLYVMKTDASKESIKYIKDNSGNINAFRDANNIAYQNSIEIECNATARQDMVNEVSKDNGKGGTKDANNREYGGSIENGVVAVATPGEVANPKTDATVSIELPTGKPTFHSHPSGTVVDGPPAGTLGGTTTTYSFTQTPSQTDVNNAGSHTNYVFGRSENKVYIYNSKGTQASIPMNRFVTPRR